MESNWLYGIFAVLFSTAAIFIDSAVIIQLSQHTLIFDKQGHRGCRGLEPENTIQAMLTALDIGVTTLEMDTVITADGQVILSHDRFFHSEITTKPDGTYLTSVEEEQALNIYRMNYSEVVRYDVGMKPHPRFPRQTKRPAIKPLLSDVIVAAEAHPKSKRAPIQYNIETKTTLLSDGIFNPSPEVFVDTLMAVILRAGIVDRVTIQSFDFRTLKYLHVRYPTVTTSALIEELDIQPLAIHLNSLGFVPTVYSPHFTSVTKELVDLCHGMNLTIIPWTINELEEMQRVIALGVDGVITDYPDLFAFFAF